VSSSTSVDPVANDRIQRAAKRRLLTIGINLISAAAALITPLRIKLLHYRALVAKILADSIDGHGNQLAAATLR